MYYPRKLIISGRYFELYEYEKSLKKDFTRTKKKITESVQLLIDDLIDPNKRVKDLVKRIDSITRTRNQIRRNINANPDLTKFVTLTFAENITDVETANEHFHKFIKRLTYKFVDLKYFAIIEFQHRGAVHYHFLSDLAYIKSKELEKIWGHGFIKINKIKHVENIGAYVCKYLQKDMTETRLFNKKKFFYSKNLEKPIEIYDDKEITNTLEYYDLSNAEPEYKNKFSNDFIGNVEYKVFKLKI